MKMRKAIEQDFPQIIAIYNQAIPCRRITADLEPVTENGRRAWFDAHLNHDRHPIWVLESAVEIGRILGWCSFSPFYQRAAFAQTVEISIYLDEQAKGKGYGSQALQFLQAQMQDCGVNTLMAYVIEENQVSRKMFEKQGFEQWGRYPNIANMGDSLQTFLIYGYQKHP
ncbi:GNAT family N-acetyltransferase [Actinobacillus porcinus]|nr:GNAT family N-acetyltransferase [Actinobacillus porcinus]MCI5763255.1 N-acetyltransferase family protein [Actinobacillus porcinus]MDY5422644.1 N-acetyltransferase family protein [Actinobacillus porcinus]MDY6216366.1 N-acetyltransferase family protein [Actinobacillus porcinus]